MILPCDRLGHVVLRSFIGVWDFGIKKPLKCSELTGMSYGSVEDNAERKAWLLKIQRKVKILLEPLSDISN